jgi:integrase
LTQINTEDTDRRTLPLTDELVQLLAEHQSAQPDGYPYVFVSSRRYEFIQEQKREGQWNVLKGSYPLSNFDRQFKALLRRSGIEGRTFHDLRRTCLTNWLRNGLREHDVMNMAGHASFETTRKFYLAIRDDLLDQTRQASAHALESISVARLLLAPSKSS